MSDFILAEVLRGQLQRPGDVSESDTNREQIEYISLDRIDNDPNNFYELSGVEELAANIELLGLQQPLRVRQNPEAPDRVVIVSGHRRRAALQKLVDEGRADLREVPCIRDRAEGSAALQELRLIYANSDTRVLTSAELSRQAERVEELLYQLKEEGMEFPGRMRDHVAEACKVSKTKLARLKMIRDNLIPEFAKKYQANKLAESSAYTLAQQSAEVQKLVWTYTDTKDLAHLSEWQVSNMIGRIKPVLERNCRHKAGGPPCEHQAALFAKIFDDSYSYKPCDRMCCDKCEKLASCKSACPLLAEKVKKLRTDRAAQNKQEKLARQERDRPEVEAISEFWAREALARSMAGKSVKALFKATESYYSDENEKTWLEREAQQKIKRGDTLPFGMYGFYLENARKLVATANFLGVTTDYLLGRTEEPRPPEPEGQLVICGWCPGGTFPREPCDVVADFRISGEPGRPDGNLRRICWFDGAEFLFKRHGPKVDAECVRWMVLPPVAEDVSESDTSHENKETL